MNKEKEILCKKSQQCIGYNEFDILNKLNYIESYIIANNKQNAEILKKITKIENIYNNRYLDFISTSNINDELENLNINKHNNIFDRNISDNSISNKNISDKNISNKNISDKNSKEFITNIGSTYCSYIL